MLAAFKVETLDPGPLPICIAVLAVQHMASGIDRTIDHSKKN